MKKLTLSALLNRVENHFPDKEVTIDIAADIAAFVRGQAEPHAVFRTNDVGVLCCTVTGHNEATFPVHKWSGYPTQMDALKSAAAWAQSAGALTYEWLGKEATTDVGSQPVHEQCDWPNCEVYVAEHCAYYIANPEQKDIPLPDMRLCQYHYGRAGGTVYKEPEDTMPETCAAHQCGALLAGGATGKPVEIDGLWFCQYHGNLHRPRISDDHDPEEHVIHDLTLDRHSSLWQVVRCMQNAIKQMSDNDNCYADDEEGTNISHEEVDVIINHLTHGNEWSAIQYSDAMGIGEDS